MTLSLFAAAHQYLTLDQRVSKWISSSSKPPSKLKQMATQLSNFDFDSFTHAKHIRSRISSPPMGAMILIMYLGLLVPRAHRALQRAPQKPDGKKDHREFWDVIRRDLWGITFYIFGFKAINKRLAHWAQQKFGVQLTNSKGQVFGFSDHATNAHIYNGTDLKQHWLNGNQKALHAAANDNRYLGLSQALKQQHPDIFDKAITHILALRKNISENNLPNMEKSFNALKQLQNTFYATQHPNNKALWANCSKFLSRYIQHKLVPLHAASFAMLFGLIGYGPVLFNTIWSKLSYHRQQSELANTSGDNITTQHIHQRFNQFNHASSLMGTQRAIKQNTPERLGAGVQLA